MIYHFKEIFPCVYDLISIRVCMFFPVRNWNQYGFIYMYKDKTIYSQWNPYLNNTLIWRQCIIIVILALDTVIKRI